MPGVTALKMAARKPVAVSVRSASAEKIAFVNATCTRTRLRIGGSRGHAGQQSCED